MSKELNQILNQLPEFFICYHYGKQEVYNCLLQRIPQTENNKYDGNVFVYDNRRTMRRNTRGRRQLVANIPFLQSTLPKLMMQHFFSEEDKKVNQQLSQFSL